MNAPITHKAPSNLGGQSSDWADFNVSLHDMTRDMTQDKAFGFDEKGLLLRSNEEAYGGFTSVHREEEERKERKRDQRRVIQQASSSTVNIGKLLDDRIRGLKGEIEKVNKEIEITEEKLGAAKEEQENAIEEERAAEEVLKETEVVEEENHDKANTELSNAADNYPKELAEAKTPTEEDAVNKKFIELAEKVTDVKKDRDERVGNAKGEVDIAKENRAHADHKVTGLKTKCEELEAKRAGLTAKLKEYEDFKEKFDDSPEIQQKLEDGTLTLQDLKDAGAPQEVLDQFKGQELNQKLNSDDVLTKISSAKSNTTAQLEELDKHKNGQGHGNGTPNETQVAQTGPDRTIQSDVNTTNHFNAATNGTTPNLVASAPSTPVVANNAATFTV